MAENMLKWARVLTQDDLAHIIFALRWYPKPDPDHTPLKWANIDNYEQIPRMEILLQDRHEVMKRLTEEGGRGSREALDKLKQPPR